MALRLDGQDYYRLGMRGTCLSEMDRWHKWEDNDPEKKRIEREKGVVGRLRWVAKSPTSPDPSNVRAVKLIAQARRAGQITEEAYRKLLKNMGCY